MERSAAQQNLQYCQQLLHLALSFLHRLIEASLTRLAEQDLAETEEEDTAAEEDDDVPTPIGSVQSPPFRTFLSTDSRLSRLRMPSESSTTHDLVDSLSVEKLSKAVSRLRAFVKPAAPVDGDTTAGSARGSIASLASGRGSVPALGSRPGSAQIEPAARPVYHTWPEKWMDLEDEVLVYHFVQVLSMLVSSQFCNFARVCGERNLQFEELLHS